MKMKQMRYHTVKTIQLKSILHSPRNVLRQGDLFPVRRIWMRRRWCMGIVGRPVRLRVRLCRRGFRGRRMLPLCLGVRMIWRDRIPKRPRAVWGMIGISLLLPWEWEWVLLLLVWWCLNILTTISQSENRRIPPRILRPPQGMSLDLTKQLSTMPARVLYTIR